MSLFPVCCYTCRKVINPYYEPFRRKVRAIQSEAAASRAGSCAAAENAAAEGAAAEGAAAENAAAEGAAAENAAAEGAAAENAAAEGAAAENAAAEIAPLSEAQQKDMVAGALSSLGIHNLCCRIIFLSFVDAEMDELAARGEHLGDGIFAKTAGELSGTVRVIRVPTGGRRLKPSVLLAR
jgi:DNA-directed RNA polymerase subunit N (RpoN/RPB10)